MNNQTSYYHFTPLDHSAFRLMPYLWFLGYFRVGWEAERSAFSLDSGDRHHLYF